MGDRVYEEEQSYGDWTGFYDWLRNPAGQVVGVRYCPFDETRFLIEDLRNFEYIDVPAGGLCLEIHFWRGEHVDRRKSDDQDFGLNKIFRASSTSGWLISFDTTALSISELAGLRASPAKWEAVSVMNGVEGRKVRTVPRKKLEHKGKAADA